MLDGHNPQSEEDWQRCVNFWAANISSGLKVAACALMSLILGCPLDQETIEEIAEFQAAKKGCNDNN